MEKNRTIELQKTRSLGELISDSFIFLRIHARALIGPYLVVTLPLAFLAVFPIISYSRAITGGGLFNPAPTYGFPVHFTAEVFGSLFLMSAVFSLSFVAGMSSLLGYVDLLKATDGSLPSFSETLTAFGKYFPKMLLNSIPVFLLLILLTCLLIIPGIWFSIISFIFYPVLVLEGLSLSAGIARSRYLVKDYWWQTFLIIIIASFMVGIITGFVSFFFGIFFLTGRLNTLGTPVLSTGFVLITFIPALLRVVLQLYIFVAVLLQYYNLKELKEGGSLTDRIAGLGQRSGEVIQPRRKEEF